MVRVSYVLTTKDRPEFMKTTLAAAAKFVTDDDELIVVNGGQPVDCAADILIEEPDNGIADAVNKGLAAASGEYIKHLTDDDELRLLRKRYIADESQWRVFGEHEYPPVWDGEFA